MQIDDYISIPQAALHLGKTRQTIWRHAKGGKIKAIKIGNVFAVNKYDLRQLQNLRPGRRVGQKYETPVTQDCVPDA